MNAATENEMHDGGGTTRPPRGKLVVVALVVAALLGVGLWLSYRPVPGQLQGMVDAREIRVIVDVVPNHSSSEHPWFVESRASRDNPKRDWYVWRDPRDHAEPNNWESFFSGPAWDLDLETQPVPTERFDLVVT